MRDRTKIIVNNREVSKRYLGSRLVWEEEPLREIPLKVNTITLFSTVISFYKPGIKNTFKDVTIYKIKIENSKVLDLDLNLQYVDFLGSDNMYIRNLHQTLHDELKLIYPNNKRSVTFYVK